MKTKKKDLRVKKSGKYAAFITPLKDLHIVKASALENGEFNKNPKEACVSQHSPSGEKISHILPERKAVRSFVIGVCLAITPPLCGVIVFFLLEFISLQILDSGSFDSFHLNDESSILERIAGASIWVIFIWLLLLAPIFIPLVSLFGSFGFILGGILFGLALLGLLISVPLTIRRRIQVKLPPADGSRVPFYVGLRLFRLYVMRSGRYRLRLNKQPAKSLGSSCQASQAI